MTGSSFELYKRGNLAKLNLHWQGVEAGPEKFVPTILAHLDFVKKIVIVSDCTPNTFATCLRMITILTKQLERIGVDSSVVLQSQEMRDAVEMTGFDHLFTVFATEQEAAQAMGIVQLYPLELIKAFSQPPEPLVA